MEGHTWNCIPVAEAGGSGFRGHLVRLLLKTHRNPKQKQQHVILMLWSLSSLVICDGVLFCHGLLLLLLVVVVVCVSTRILLYSLPLIFLGVLMKYKSGLSDLEFCPMHSFWSGQMVMECLKTCNRGDVLPTEPSQNVSDIGLSCDRWSLHLAVMMFARLFHCEVTV